MDISERSVDLCLSIIQPYVSLVMHMMMMMMMMMMISQILSGVQRLSVIGCHNHGDKKAIKSQVHHKTAGRC